MTNIGWHILAAMVFLYVLVVTFPHLDFQAIDPGHLDGGWRLALNFIANSNYLYGRDVLFTYGPLGFIFAPENIGSNLSTTIQIALVAHLCLVGLLLIYLMGSSSKLQFGLFALCLALAAASGLSFEYYLLAIMLLTCYLPSRLGQPKTIIGVLTGILGAFLILVKFNLGVDSILTIALATLCWRLEFGRHANKLIMTTFSAYVISLAILTAIFFKSAGNLVRWLYGSLEVARGYYEAQTIIEQQSSIVLASILCVTFGAIAIALLLKKNRMSYLMLIGTVSVLMAFKHSFIRCGSFEQYFFQWLMALIAIIGLSCRSLRSQYACLASFIIVTLFSYPTLFRLGISPSYIATVLDTTRTRQVISAMIDKKSLVKKLDVSTKQNINQYQLPNDLLNTIRLAGNPPVTALPDCLGYCYANNLLWSPLPVLQQYIATTPYLDKLCADYFGSQSAPEFLIYGSPLDLIWSFGEIDQRNPILEAPLTAFSLLANYTLKTEYKNPDVLLLKRREQPQRLLLTKHRQDTFSLGQWLPIPKNNQLLVARIKLHLNLIGFVLPKLYRLPPMTIDLACKRGFRTYRLAPSNLSSGILLNFVPTDFHEMAELMNGGKPNSVMAFRISGPGCLAFNRRFEIQWLNVENARD